jgi:predicted Zn-ribbon and HTH transcriptional regulator
MTLKTARHVKARVKAARKAKAARTNAETKTQATQQRKTTHMHPKACVKCKVNFWSHDLYQIRCEKCQAVLGELIKRVKAKLKERG